MLLERSKDLFNSKQVLDYSCSGRIDARVKIIRGGSGPRIELDGLVGFGIRRLATKIALMCDSMTSNSPSKNFVLFRGERVFRRS